MCVIFEAEAQEFKVDDGKGGGGAENEGFTKMPEQPITVSLSYLFFGFLVGWFFLFRGNLDWADWLRPFHFI